MTTPGETPERDTDLLDCPEAIWLRIHSAMCQECGGWSGLTFEHTGTDNAGGFIKCFACDGILLSVRGRACEEPGR